ERAVRMIDDLELALDATSFVRERMPDALTTRRMTRALLATLPSMVEDQREVDAAPNEGDYMERIALGYPVTASSCRRQIVSFVLRLAADAGVDTGSEVFNAWVQVAAGGHIVANDLRRLIEEEARSART